MGVCSSTKDNSSRSPSKPQATTSELNQSPSGGIAAKQSEPLPVINRLSNKTKYDDINKYINISDTFLGKGATGIVREGSNSKGEKFAVKTVWKADVEQNECFKREIEITLNLNHDNVVKCVEIYEDISSINLVLELINGGDLFDHIIHSPQRKLSENEAIDILEQILQALRYLHEEVGVIHRDIKPENFLMYNENGRNKVKLIDFGFATYIPKDGSGLTQQLGTPQYAAPELFLNQPYSSKVDLWSTGVVLYNMINGTQPFSTNKNNPNLVKEQVLTKEINFSGFLNPQLKQLCQHLLERDPEKRCSVVQALCELSLVKVPDPSTQTVPSNFNPDIHKIIFILSNDRALGDELRNKLLTYLSLDQIIQLYKDLTNSEETELGNGMLAGKTYLKAEKIITFSLNQEYIPNELKEQLKIFKEAKGEEKLQRQMINANRFFITAIEGKKFIQKQRVWHEFQKHDKGNRGYLDKTQIDSIFNDSEKKARIPQIRTGERIDFEKFYHLCNTYENIVIKSI